MLARLVTKEAPVALALLSNFSSFSQHAGLETFLSFNVSKTGDKRSPSSLSNPLEILLLAPPDCHGSCLHEILKTQVVNTTSGQDDISSGGEDLVDPLFGDVTLPVPHHVQLVRVGHQQLDPHLHLHLLQGEVQAGNLGIGDGAWHLLGRDCAVKSITLDKHGLSG